jgi:hypothetical protein
MPSAEKKPQTLYDKVFEAHIVDGKSDGTILLYIGMRLELGLAKPNGLLLMQIDIWFMRSPHQYVNSPAPGDRTWG